jgi:hypothetical protein
VRALITHESAHAVGATDHTSDPLDIMFEQTIDWIRDGHFSAAAADRIQIQNKLLP